MVTQKDCWKFIKPLMEEIMKLKKQTEILSEDSALIKMLNNEYPEAFVLYRGRSLPFSKTICEVPVSVLVTPNDWQITRDLKLWNLHNIKEDLETLVPKIYKNIYQKFYKYEYDGTVWGSNEVWEFPFESRTRYGKGIDCDSWAIVQASYYIAAGVNPAFVWCVAGMSSLGGHCTVYVYSKNDNKFHHLNSTYGGTLYNQVHLYPTHNDAREGIDKIGIHSVWFSFNNERSRTTFESSTGNKELKKFKFEK